MTLYKMALRPSDDFGRVTIDEIVVDLDKFTCAEPRDQGHQVAVTFGDRVFRLDETGWARLKEALGKIPRRGLNQFGRPEPVSDPARTMRDTWSTTGDATMRIFQEATAAAYMRAAADMLPRPPADSEIPAYTTTAHTTTVTAGDSGELTEERS